MKIAVITHYYPPEIGAPQARLSEMAKEWKRSGHRVNVITCFPNHPTGKVPEKYFIRYKLNRYMEETIDGVQVTRCWVYATPNKGFVKKILGHLSFMITSVLQGREKVKGCDVIVVSSPTFFSVFSAWFLSKLYHIPYIFEVRDLWPAIFVELGVLKNRYVIKILEYLELFLYHQAAAVVPVTRTFGTHISQRGVSSKKIHVITNGVDVERFYPREKNRELSSRYGLENKWVIMYVGAHGISHALHRIVDAAKMLEGVEEIQFVFVGEGAEKVFVCNHAEKEKVKNCLFLPGHPKELIPEFYSVMDIGLVPLRNVPLFDTFIPSKMFEIMAMQRPIVASVGGEAREILESSGGAIVVDPEDAVGIAESILDLYNNKEKANALAKKGVQFVRQHYDRVLQAQRYVEIMDNRPSNSRRGL